MLDASQSLGSLHRSLVDELEPEVVDVMDSLADRFDTSAAVRAALDDPLGDVLDGRLLSSLSKAVVDDDHRDEFLSLLRRCGHSHADGQRLDGSVRSILPALLATTTTASTTISLSLGVDWGGVRRDRRVDLLEFAADLALGVDVNLIVSGPARAVILDDHRDSLPAHCLKSLRDRRGTETAHETTVDDALRSLQREGRPVAVLRHLLRASTDSLSYSALSTALAMDSPPYETVRRLDDDLSLVERSERSDGTTVVSLRPSGRAVVDSLDDETAASDGGRAVPSAGSWSHSGSDSAESHNPPKSLPTCRVVPGDGRGPGDPHPDAADGTARPPSEAADAADGDRRDRYAEGLVTPTWAARRTWLPACESVDAGEVAVVDADPDDPLAEDRDGRRPHVSYDADADTIYVGARYSNPLQFAVSVAHGLTSETMLSATDWADRIGRGLSGLSIDEKPVLWSATCLGWLPSEVEDGADVIDHWREARDDLMTASGKAGDDDSEVTRSGVTRTALGLLTTVIDVMDLLGVEVVVEARVGEVSRHFGEANADRRRDLLHHLATLSALQTRIGAFSGFRQLFEDRADRRSDAFTPTFDGGKPGRKGSMNAGIVVTGDGADELADDLADRVQEPRPLHEDAPPVSVDVDVVTGVDRSRSSRTARRMLRSRGLRPTPEAAMTMTAFCRSPWAVADGLYRGLTDEDRRREVYLDEVRRALSALDSDRLLPDAARSARDGIAALIDADRPLSQREMCDRAGISPQSWRNHRDDLLAAGLVDEDSDGWRLCLPFRSERHDEDSGVLPWYLSAEDDVTLGTWESRRASDVLLWLLLDAGLLDDPDRLDSDEQLARAFDLDDDLGIHVVDTDDGLLDDVLREWSVPASVIRASACAPGPRSTTAVIGQSTRQRQLG